MTTKRDFSGVLSGVVHRKGPFCGETVGFDEVVHWRACFHGEVVGKTRFIHEEVGFGGEKGRQGARKERLPVEPAMTERSGNGNDGKGPQ